MDIPFLEVSSRTSTNVDELFHDLVLAILERLAEKTDDNNNNKYVPMLKLKKKSKDKKCPVM